MFDFVRIACAVPNVHVADVAKNKEEICALIDTAAEKNVNVVVFPELCVTGYTYSAFSCGK